MRRSLLYVLTLVAAAGLLSVTTSPEPRGPIPVGEVVHIPSASRWELTDPKLIHPVPAIYSRWLDEVSSCMGIKGDIRDIYFYRSAKGRTPSGQLLAGLHFPVGARSVIVLFGWHDGIETTVKHELVHYLLWKQRGSGDADHVTSWYSGCGHEGPVEHGPPPNMPEWSTSISRGVDGARGSGLDFAAKGGSGGDGAAPQEGSLRFYLVNAAREVPIVYSQCGGIYREIGRGAPRELDPVAVAAFEVAPNELCGWGRLHVKLGAQVFTWERTRTAEVKPLGYVICLANGEARLRAYRLAEGVDLDCS